MIKFYCVQCSGKIGVEASQAGRDVTCPACGARCRVPGAVTASPNTAARAGELLTASLEAPASGPRTPSGETGFDPDATVMEEAYTGPVPGEPAPEADPIDWQLIHQSAAPDADSATRQAGSRLGDTALADQADPLAGLALALGVDPKDLQHARHLRRPAWYTRRGFRLALLAFLLLLPVGYLIAHRATTAQRQAILADAQAPIHTRLTDLLRQTPQGAEAFSVESLTPAFRGWPIGVPAQVRFSARIVQQEAGRARQAGIITGLYDHRQGLCSGLEGRVTFDAPGRYEEFVISDHSENDWDELRRQAEAQRLADEAQAQARDARERAAQALEEVRQARDARAAADLIALQEAVYQYAGASLPLMRDIQQHVARQQAGPAQPARNDPSQELAHAAHLWHRLGTYQLQILLSALDRAPGTFTGPLDQAVDDLAGQLQALDTATQILPTPSRTQFAAPASPGPNRALSQALPSDLREHQRATTEAFLQLLLIAEQIDQASEALGPHRPSAPTDAQALTWRQHRLHLLRAEVALHRQLLQRQRFQAMTRAQQAGQELVRLSQVRLDLEQAAAVYRNRVLAEQRLRRSQLETQQREALARLEALDQEEARLLTPLALQGRQLAAMTPNDLRRVMQAERRELRHIAQERSVDLLAPTTLTPSGIATDAEPSAAPTPPRRLRPLWPRVGETGSE